MGSGVQAPVVLPRRDAVEEIANATSHGFGALLSLAGLLFMLPLAADRGEILQLLGITVFCTSLVVVYLASTLYHCVPHGKWKFLFRIVDQVCIYLFIAGSYTPFSLTLLPNSWGWTLLLLIWGFALVGIAYRLAFAHRHHPVLSTLVYLLMGWLAVIAVEPIMQSIAPAGLVWIVTGGVCYTLGVVFLLLDKRVRFFHTVWHLFVLAGSTCHFIAILFYVIR